MSRSQRSSSLLQRLRRVRQVRHLHDGEISDSFYDTQPEPPAVVKSAQRSAMYALVPLSLIGTATLFVIGFVGSHMMVEYLVGKEYLPTTITASRTDAQVAATSPAATTKFEARPARDETQIAAPPVVAEVNGTTSILTATAPQPAEAEQPAAAAASVVNSAAEDSAEEATSGAPTPQMATNEPAPAATEAEVPLEANDETPASGLDAQPLVESVLGTREKPKTAPAEPAETPKHRIEPTGAPVTGQAVEPAEAAAPDTSRQAAPTINQTDETTQSPAAADSIRVDLAEAARIFGAGQRLMAAGNIASARLLYQHALKAGDPRAATALGKSYDPVVFEQLNVHGVTPDANLAIKWYQRGADGGDTEATSYLQALTTWLKN